MHRPDGPAPPGGASPARPAGGLARRPAVLEWWL